MWTLGTIAVFVAVLVSLMALSWLALNIIPRAAAVAAHMQARASESGSAALVAYYGCWILLFPLMLLICVGGGFFDWILELKGQTEPARPSERKA